MEPNPNTSKLTRYRLRKRRGLIRNICNVFEPNHKGNLLQFGLKITGILLLWQPVHKKRRLSVTNIKHKNQTNADSITTGFRILN